MANEYSGRWFSACLGTMPEEWTQVEVEGITERIPRPELRTVLDICCGSIANGVADGRLVSTITYVDGTTDAMDFELIDPDDLAGRAGGCGPRVVEACCWWDRSRPPTPEEHRYQVVLERAGPSPPQRHPGAT